MGKRLAKRWRIILALASVAVAIAIACRPLLIAYHRRAAQSAFAEGVVPPPPSTQSFFKQISRQIFGQRYDSFERYEAHRDRLVELGALVHRTFVFEHLTCPSPEYRALWRIIHATFSSIHTTSHWSETPEPMVLQVWDTPEMIPKWEAFVREHDVPDFLGGFQHEIREAEQISRSRQSEP